jgi:small subunit ribosomal protein S6
MARLQSLRDKPDTSREYETIYILRPNTPNEGVAEVNTRIKGVIEGMGGKILKIDNWGKRRLAYEVAKERKGIYLYWLYLAQPGVVEETERNLRMLDSVIRYLTVKVDEDIDVTARPTELDDTSFEKAAQTAADEEDLFLSRGSDETPSDDDDEFGGDEFEDVPVMNPGVPAAPEEKE